MPDFSLVHQFLFVELTWYLLYFYCPDFAMQKSWGWPSLFYDFGEVSCQSFIVSLCSLMLITEVSIFCHFLSENLLQAR